MFMFMLMFMFTKSSLKIRLVTFFSSTAEGGKKIVISSTRVAKYILNSPVLQN